MLYSRSSEYAITALMGLAKAPQGEFLMVKPLSRELDLPPSFLAKVLQVLARSGILQSRKGPTGGFALKLAAKDIPLSLIVATLDGGLNFPRHLSKAMAGQIELYLEQTTIAELVELAEQTTKRNGRGRG